ncbi:UPF0280 family protein, partial [Candidatus Electronema sp. TJ]|uniref:UPF0280 family protein n=1 Tax=Candidatus Electronema sp. TJ TaxID=3401573 RepID=UPI003AA8F3A0
AKTPLSYQERTYRSVQNSGLVASEVKMAETDLHILADRPVEDMALLAVAKVRAEIEGYIRQHPLFLSSLSPLPLDSGAPEPVQAMLAAGLAAGVGPMAAVAGVIAEAVGRELLRQGLTEVIVENGGDLFLARTQPSVVAVYAGASRLSGKLGICLQPEQLPCGLCCSSGTVGHSLSFGVADAAAVLASSAAIADAAATRLGNEVKSRDSRSVSRAVGLSKQIEGVTGAVVIVGDHLGAWGTVELTQL